MDVSLERGHGALDLHGIDQHILEEDYDENYEPTEEGRRASISGYHGHDRWCSIAALCSRIKEMSASVLDRQDIFDA